MPRATDTPTAAGVALIMSPENAPPEPQRAPRRTLPDDGRNGLASARGPACQHPTRNAGHTCGGVAPRGALPSPAVKRRARFLGGAGCTTPCSLL